MIDKKIGLYQKYLVCRSDQRDLHQSDKHYGCDYFVLDITHDKFAGAAIAAYADACEKEYPMLAADLRAKIRQQEMPS